MRRPVRRVLTAVEREALIRRRKEIQVQLKAPMLTSGPLGEPMWVPDHSGLERPQLAEAEERRIGRALERGHRPDLTPGERRERDRKIRILEERVKKALVPHKHYHMKDQDSAEYRKVVSNVVRQQTDPVLVQDIAELKNLRRERNPDDPNAGNIEDLRKDR